MLGRIKSHEIRIGEWVHVMGYIRNPEKKPSIQLHGVEMEICIQALVMWSAGPVKLDEYEELQDKLKVERLATTNHAP